jgi:predicted MFS family arabinose efflux permease
MILSGWVVYAIVYLAFGLAGSTTVRIALFMAYGIYFGLTEPAEKAWIARLVSPHLRGTAFGCYHGVIGLGALPASLLFGLLWQVWGVAEAFATGAGLAVAACFLLFQCRE